MAIRWKRVAVIAAVAYFAIALYGHVRASPMLANPGTLMNPIAPSGAAPPPVTYDILTEAGDAIITEAGDHIVTEAAP